MGLVERISEDLKTAMKDRDADRTRALRMMRAAIIEEQKKGTGEVTEERVVETFRRIRKQRVESVEAYRAANRPELAAEEEAEMKVIDAYLPQTADELTTREWVKAAIAQSGAASAKDVGKVMGLVMKAHKGEVDPGLTKKLAEAELPPA